MQTIRIGTTIIELNDASPAIIYGHADADGHLAAEHTRTNLRAKGIDVSDVVITPETRNYRFWERTLPGLDFGRFRLVVFVDIAFSFRDPSSSLESLLVNVDQHPDTRFVVIDHHPLKQPVKARSNLALVEADTAYNCCLGTPSDELMVLAAICDGDREAVKSRTSREISKRALGVSRAAADLHGMVGYRLLSLLRHRRWEFFESLAEEPQECHRNVRGRRVASGLKSPLLEAARNGVI